MVLLMLMAVAPNVCDDTHMYQLLQSQPNQCRLCNIHMQICRCQFKFLNCQFHSVSQFLSFLHTQPQQQFRHIMRIFVAFNFVAINFVASSFAHVGKPPIDNSTADCDHGVTCFPCHPKSVSKTAGKSSWGALVKYGTYNKPTALPMIPGINCSATSNVCYHNRDNIILHHGKVHTVC